MCVPAAIPYVMSGVGVPGLGVKAIQQGKKLLQGPAMPTPAAPGEPLKQIDEASANATGEARKRMLMMKGLESTWTRQGMAPVSAGAKSANLGGTKTA